MTDYRVCTPSNLSDRHFRCLPLNDNKRSQSLDQAIYESYSSLQLPTHYLQRLSASLKPYLTVEDEITYPARLVLKRQLFLFFRFVITLLYFMLSTRLVLN